MKKAGKNKKSENGIEQKKTAYAVFFLDEDQIPSIGHTI